MLPSNIVQGVAIGNLKAISEQPAMLSNLAYSDLVTNNNLSQQNAVATQQAMNEIGLAVTGKAVTNVANLGPLEARSAVDVLSNNELAQTIADLKATVQAFRSDPSVISDVLLSRLRAGTDEIVLIFEDPAIMTQQDLRIRHDRLNRNLFVSIAPRHHHR